MPEESNAIAIPFPALPKKRSISGAVIIAGGMLWILLLGFGFLLLDREEFTPTQNHPNHATFPSNSGIKLDASRPTILLFAHPKCPCTRASLHELSELREEIGNNASITVVFTIPKGVPPDWEKGELWTTAETMNGIRVFRDQNGDEATRFGVYGSGHVLVYSPAGALLFSGGITPSRGHEGDNPGRSAVTSLVLTGHSSISRTPVFGCSLL
jgi:hypothetical protein